MAAGWGNQGEGPKVIELVQKYRELFPDEIPDGLPPPRSIDMRIITIPDAKIPQTGSPRFSAPEVNVMREIMQKLLRKGWIRRPII